MFLNPNLDVCERFTVRPVFTLFTHHNTRVHGPLPCSPSRVANERRRHRTGIGPLLAPLRVVGRNRVLPLPPSREAQIHDLFADHHLGFEGLAHAADANHIPILDGDF